MRWSREGRVKPGIPAFDLVLSRFPPLFSSLSFLRTSHSKMVRAEISQTLNQIRSCKSTTFLRALPFHISQFPQHARLLCICRSGGSPTMVVLFRAKTFSLGTRVVRTTLARSSSWDKKQTLARSIRGLYS